MRVNLEMPDLYDNDKDFFTHWRMCENVAMCQTAGRDLTDLDFISLYSATMKPEGVQRIMEHT